MVINLAGAGLLVAMVRLFTTLGGGVDAPDLVRRLTQAQTTPVLRELRVVSLELLSLELLSRPVTSRGIIDPTAESSRRSTP